MKEKYMDIQLKQNEIDQAIRRYVADEIGINLTNKRLGIKYSATRGESGLIASLVIDDMSDVEIPGFTDRNADPVPSTDAPKATVHTLTSGSVNTAESISDPVVTEEVVEEVVAVPVEEAATTKSGLFAD